MAVEWRWNEKCGEATINRLHGNGKIKPTTVNLYKGNAYLIMLDEWEENGQEMWNMYSFWLDKNHMKNCLGLTKGKDYYNIYDTGTTKLTSITINKKKCSNYKEIVTALVQAFDTIDIKIISEE